MVILRAIAGPIAGFIAFVVALLLFGLSYTCYDDTPGILGNLMIGAASGTAATMAAGHVGRMPGLIIFVVLFTLLQLTAMLPGIVEADAIYVASLVGTLVGTAAGAMEAAAFIAATAASKPKGSDHG